MLRRFISAAAVLIALGGFVLGGTYQGQIVKVEDGKVTIKTGKRGEDPVEKTFKVSKDVKITIKARDKDGEDKTVKLEDLKSVVEKAGKGGKGGKGKGGRGGARAKIETTGEGDSETITTITFGGGRGKGKGGKGKGGADK